MTMNAFITGAYDTAVGELPDAKNATNAVYLKTGTSARDLQVLAGFSIRSITAFR